MDYDDRFEATNDDAYELHTHLHPNQPASNMCLAQFKDPKVSDPDQWHVCTRVTKHEGRHKCHWGVCGASIERTDHLKQMVNNKDYHPNALYGREFALQQEVIDVKAEASRLSKDNHKLTEINLELIDKNEQLERELNQTKMKLDVHEVSGAFIVKELAKALGIDLSDKERKRNLLPEVIKILETHRDRTNVSDDKDSDETGRHLDCDNQDEKPCSWSQHKQCGLIFSAITNKGVEHIICDLEKDHQGIHVGMDSEWFPRYWY